MIGKRNGSTKAGLTIGKKLLMGVTVLVVSLAVLSIISLRTISTLSGSLDAAVNSTGKKLDLVGKTREAFQELKDRSLRAQVAYAIGALERKSAAGEAKNCSACHTPAPIDESARGIEAAQAVVRQHTGELRRLLSDEKARKSLETTDRMALQWAVDAKEYLRLANANRFEEAHSILRERGPINGEVEKAAKLLAEREGEELSTNIQQAQRTISGARWAVFAVIVFNLLVGATVLAVVFRIAATLRHTVIEISKGIKEVATVASEVSASSQSLAQGASEQAASLEETSASSEEINAAAQRNSENSRETAVLVSGSQQKFNETEEALRELEMAMGRIDSSSAKISQIIKVIDEIAFQTNILALNASVEAARAGEAGLGFAVVADEVRNLAQRCAQAAKDTAGMIEESIDNSRQGKMKVDRVATAIQTISEQTGTIKRLVGEVSMGSQEQALGVAQVAKALAQMEQVTQRTAANAELNAAAGEELSVQSKTLYHLTGQLKTMVDG